MANYTFPTATPESQGIPSEAVVRFLEAMQREGAQLNSVMILRHGKLVAKGFWDPYKPEYPHVCHSFTKSVVSTTIGLLIAEGKLSVEDKVLSFFPEDAPSNPSENLKKIRIKHLLSMSCGHEKEPRMTTDNYVREFLAHPVLREPGTYFVYNSMGSYMLTAIIRKVTGINMTEYLKPRLFDKMGIHGYRCATCPRGTENGGGGLQMRTEDMAKMAQLWLNMGVWEGETLLSPDYIREATAIHIVQKEGWNPRIAPGMEDYFSGYGYQVWRNTVPGSYRFDGLYGQLAMILPKYDMVVLTTSATLRIYKILTTTWRMLIPALTESPLPEDPEGYARMGAFLTDLSVPWMATQPRQAEMEKTVEGRRIILPKNTVQLFTGRFTPPDEGLEVMSLTFGEKEGTFVYSQGGRETQIPIGLDGTRVVSEAAGSGVASTGNWLDENTYRLDLQQLNSVFHYEVTLALSGKDVSVTVYHTPNDVDASVSGRYTPAMTVKGYLE